MSEEIRDQEDRVSKLPDDILVDILSRLTLDEAARTSVLSNRWKHLWTFTPSLQFYFFELSKNVTEATIEEDRSWYVDWVNEVLGSHRSFSINEFSICFDLDNSHEFDITNWIYTAMFKRVRDFELNFHPVLSWPSSHELYTFPQKFCDIFSSRRGLSCIKYLRSLFFDSVNISGEILEFFIHNCPNLDQLSVESSDNLLRLKVVGSFIRLEHLDVAHCCKLEEIEISCPSLLSFKYFGRAIKYSIKDVPRLLDVSIGGGHRIGTGSVIGPVVSYFPQLETLELHVEMIEENVNFPQCKLPGLRHLTFHLTARHCSNLLGLTSMMKSCPMLQKLRIKLLVGQYSSEVRSRHQFPKHSHQQLKAVELIGFSGDPVELELAYYLLENATMLEEIMVEPWEFATDTVIEAARERAKKLEEEVGGRVKLVIH